VIDRKSAIELVNAATREIKVPQVPKQKQEFYKAGVRDVLKELQLQIDKIKN